MILMTQRNSRAIRRGAWLSRLAPLCLALALLACLCACRSSDVETPEPLATDPAATPTPRPTARPVTGYSEIRPAAVADAFYPADPEQAALLVERFLAPVQPTDGAPIALIVPHAGWAYSGHVAAFAFKQMEGHAYDAVVIIGPNHSDPGFDRISVYAEGAFEAPGGAVPVDEALAAELLAAHEGIVFERGAHQREHSIEVQLPFLEHVCPECAMVPVVIGQPTAENLEILTAALIDVLQDRQALVIASSDLSHYPKYDDAVRVDTTTLAAIETMDADTVAAVTRAQMRQDVPGLVTCACGEGPIVVTMRVAQALGADHARVLRYANSGDVGGDRDRVVGYGAVMFWRWEPPDLSEAQQAELLAIARRSLEAHLADAVADLDAPADAALSRRLGAFVTLKLGGELRGCIGHVQGDAPLYQAVAQAAVDAGVHDPRFSPVTAAQGGDVVIEVSVLSPFKRVRDVHDEAEIEVGRHGLYLLYGQQGGILLPQVPVEQGWERSEYLQQICAKAGLPGDCWERATLYTFTAQVFSE